MQKAPVVTGKSINGKECFRELQDKFTQKPEPITLNVSILWDYCGFDAVRARRCLLELHQLKRRHKQCTCSAVGADRLSQREVLSAFNS